MNKYERTHEELKKQLELLGVYDNEQAAEQKEIIASEVSEILSTEEKNLVEKSETV